MIVFKIIFSIVSLGFINGTPVEEFFPGNKIFTAALYNEIFKTTNENILVSPFSVEIVLALLHSGAKGETKYEIQNNLHLPNSTEKTQIAINELLSRMKGDKNFSLKTANKIYVKKGFSIKRVFRKVARDIYKSRIGNIDFAQSEQAASVINQWVEKRTNNKIHNIITPNDISPASVAVIINALHFKAEWEIHFKKMDNLKQKFYKTSQETVEVDMMTQFGQTYSYCEDSELDAKFLELPFKSQKVSIVIVLPNRNEGLSLVENNLHKVFTRHQFKSELLNIAIPKFRIENSLDLKQVLINLGIVTAFDENQADFSGIVGKKGQLFLDKVKQKTFIDVNENGIEAAAATFTGIMLLSLPARAPKDFIANHPFMFYITLENTILFVGRVTAPDKE